MARTTERTEDAAMKPMPAFAWGTLFSLVLVAGCATGARIWYIAECCEQGKRAPALLVQGRQPRPLNEVEHLAANLARDGWFASRAPLADDEETTAHVAPGYSLLFSAIVRLSDTAAHAVMLWLQCALGSMTTVCYFFFARRAFHSTLIATLTGLLTAFHPFWIVNTAELSDGVLASFCVAAALALGARGTQVGGAFTGLAFGLALAGAALVRGALLPFALVSLLWFLWECRRLPLGFFAGFLALIGFVNALAPWALRNYVIFDRAIPVVDSAYLHLWMGNNPLATGATLDEDALRASLGEERVKELLAEPNQAKRYHRLAPAVWREIEDHPADTLVRRAKAALVFFFGEHWFTKESKLAIVQEKSDEIAAPPPWLKQHADMILQASLLGMIVLALLGWRWSYPWRRYGRVAVIAVLFIPLPYLLGHAEALSGPRLPLDGVLLCFAGYALACFIPGVVGAPGAVKATSDT
jgi:4-amino-4-deoxy-L-arabinose transferase-like glycosyltransferase